jgi:hypothetical protein
MIDKAQTKLYGLKVIEKCNSKIEICHTHIDSHQITTYFFSPVLKLSFHQYCIDSHHPITVKN